MISANSHFKLFVVLVACLNAYASIRLYRADSLDRFQKGAQGVLVWALPLLGVLLVLAIRNASDRESIPTRLRSQIDGDGFDNAYGSDAAGEQGHSGHDAGGGDGL